jgi:hypothetical protein
MSDQAHATAERSQAFNAPASQPQMAPAQELAEPQADGRVAATVRLLAGGGTDDGSSRRRSAPARQYQALLALQRTVGNRSVQRLLDRSGDRTAESQLVQRTPGRGSATPPLVVIQRDPPPAAATSLWQPGPGGSLHLRTPTDPTSEIVALDELIQGTPRFRESIAARILGNTLDWPNGRQYDIAVAPPAGAPQPAGGAAPAEQAVSDRLGEGAFFLQAMPGTPLGLARLRSGYEVFRVGQGGALATTGLRVVVSGLGAITEGILVHVAGTVRVPASQAIRVTVRPPDSPALRAERERFLVDFERRANDVARRRLQESWDRLSQEQRHYGVYDREVQPRASDEANTAGIVAAARELIPPRRQLQRLRQEEAALRDNVEHPGRRRVGGRSLSRFEFEGERERLRQLSAARRAAEASYAELRRPRVERFRLLAAYDADDQLDALEQLSTSLPIGAAGLLMMRISEMKTGITWLRGELRRFPGRVWVLERILDQTANELGLDPRGVQRSWVRGRARAAAENDEFVRRAVDLLALLLTIGTLVATAGGAAPAVLAAAGAASAAADTGAAVLAGHDTAFQAAATHTDPDRQRAAMEGEEPSLATLVLAVVGAVGSVSAARAGLRQVARQRRVEQVAAPLRDLFERVAQRRTAGLASEAEEQALRVAGNQARAGLGDELVRRLPARTASAAGQQAVSAEEAGRRALAQTQRAPQPAGGLRAATQTAVRSAPRGTIDAPLPVRILDTTPLASGGDVGGAAGFVDPVTELRGGVFSARTPGVDGEVVVKVLPTRTPEELTEFLGEVSSAEAAAAASQRVAAAEMAANRPQNALPFRVYGVGDVSLTHPSGRGLVMDRQPGGFPFDVHEENVTPYASRIDLPTFQDLDRFADALLQPDVHGSFWYYHGECNGFVDEAGRWRPVDFRPIQRFTPDSNQLATEVAAAREQAIALHRHQVGKQIEYLDHARAQTARRSPEGGSGPPPSAPPGPAASAAAPRAGPAAQPGGATSTFAPAPGPATPSPPAPVPAGAGRPFVRGSTSSGGMPSQLTFNGAREMLDEMFEILARTPNRERLARLRQYLPQIEAANVRLRRVAQTNNSIPGRERVQVPQRWTATEYPAENGVVWRGGTDEHSLAIDELGNIYAGPGIERNPAAYQTSGTPADPRIRINFPDPAAPPPDAGTRTLRLRVPALADPPSPSGSGVRGADAPPSPGSTGVVGTSEGSIGSAPREPGAGTGSAAVEEPPTAPAPARPVPAVGQQEAFREGRRRIDAAIESLQARIAQANGRSFSGERSHQAARGRIDVARTQARNIADRIREGQPGGMLDDLLERLDQNQRNRLAQLLERVEQEAGEALRLVDERIRSAGGPAIRTGRGQAEAPLNQQQINQRGLGARRGS